MSAPTIRFRDSTASVLLDALRGFAAFAVLIAHWRSTLFVDLRELPSHRDLLHPLYVVTGAGREAVLLFFVLSGYLISGSILEAWRQGSFSWRRYWIHRLTRLWIVLLPALIAGALWDHWGIWLGQAPSLYAGDPSQGMTRDAVHSLTLRDFFGNLGFLQTIAVPTFGSNVALWTLANEFWYYALFPLGLYVARRFMRPPRATLLCLAAIGLILVLVGSNPYILPLFPIWLMGAALHALPRRPTTAAQRLAASVIFAILFFLTPHTPAWYLVGNLALDDFGFGVVSSAYLWVLLGALERTSAGLAQRLARWSASFSYTLYAVHTPLLIFIAALLVHDARWVPDGRSAAIALVVLALIVAYAWGVGALTEANTDRVRRRLEQWLPQGARSRTS